MMLSANPCTTCVHPRQSCSVRSAGGFVRSMRTNKVFATAAETPRRSANLVIPSPRLPSVSPGEKPLSRYPFQKPQEVVAMVLGGGIGLDLYPLTKTRAEPAVPFGGSYKLIDVPISNCLNSGVNQIYVLAQFNSASLSSHVTRSYQFVHGILYGKEAFVEVLNATQTPTTKSWFQGTADAVRRFCHMLQDTNHSGCEDVLILCADQVYRTDFKKLINYHRQRGADVTMASVTCDEAHACHMGVIQIDERNNRVLTFAEKPKGNTLVTMSIDAHAEEMEPVDRHYVASTGIYVFKKDVLLELLTKRYPDAAGFSEDILPFVTGELNILSYNLTDYWEDVGSLKNWYNVNIEMATNPHVQLYMKESPLYTEARMLPPAKVQGSTLVASLLSDGCVLRGATVSRTVLGPNSYIDAGSVLEDVVMFGNEIYASEDDRALQRAVGDIPMGVGRRCVLKKCVVDVNVRIGDDVKVLNAEGVVEAAKEEQGFVIRDGLVVLLPDAVLRNGTVI